MRILYFKPNKLFFTETAHGAIGHAERAIKDNKNHGLGKVIHPKYYQQLTEACAYPQLSTQPKFFDHFQTYSAIYYGHSELSREEKSKIQFEEKKVQFITKKGSLQAFLP